MRCSIYLGADHKLIHEIRRSPSPMNSTPLPSIFQNSVPPQDALASVRPEPPLSQKRELTLPLSRSTTPRLFHTRLQHTHLARYLSLTAYQTSLQSRLSSTFLHLSTAQSLLLSFESRDTAWDAQNTLYEEAEAGRRAAFLAIAARCAVYKTHHDALAAQRHLLSPEAFERAVAELGPGTMALQEEMDGNEELRTRLVGMERGLRNELVGLREEVRRGAVSYKEALAEATGLAREDAELEEKIGEELLHLVILAKG